MDHFGGLPWCWPPRETRACKLGDLYRIYAAHPPKIRPKEG